jgi:predicted AlkP superfamily phosphohydrolase/phosphomutase
VLGESNPDTVIIASDHGLGPYEKRVRVNEVLRDAGMVETVRGGEGMPNWATIRDDRLSNGEEGGRREQGWIERMLAAGASIGLTAQRIDAVLDRFGTRNFVMDHVPSAVIRAASEQVDFPNSAAYIRSRVECGIRINLEGREPNGIVPQEEYEDFREEIIALLSELETPDGAPVFSDVARREEYFHGPELERAVDVVTGPNDFDFYVTSWMMGTDCAEPEPPGWDHKINGVIAASGEGIATDVAPVGAHLFDIAPTVLATLGIKTSDRMDGQPLAFVDTPGERSYPPPESNAEVTVEDDNIKAQLESLGYLE